jgi:serine phosphatase RsbU (regulator of sigma subunit)
MFETALTIRSGERVDQIFIDAEGVLIGREDECDVVLDDAGASRQNARLYRDPFGRWIVEDLGSRNGVWIGGRRVQAQAVGPGEQILIGATVLTIDEQQTHQAPRASKSPQSEFAAQATLIDDRRADVELVSKAQQDEVLSADRLKQLNELAEDLVNAAGADELYPTICRRIASRAQQTALVLRVPAADATLPDAPNALAFASAGQTPERPPHNLSLHVSRRVLDAVRSSFAAVMAGAPTADGQRMDLTIVDDRKPRAVLAAPIMQVGDCVDVLYLDVPAEQGTEAMLDYLQAAARQANFARKGLLLAEVRAERASLDRQLDFARQIQQRLTPPAHIEGDGFDAAVHYTPAMWVGGDYCDVWTLPDGRLAWAIGDVSGKGLPAALVMATLSGHLRSAMTYCDKLAGAITGLSNHLAGHTPDDIFVTLIAGLFDPASGQLEFVNAGHPQPLLIDRDAATADELGVPANPPVGIIEHAYSAEIHELPAGATLLSVTDGIIESATPAGELFGEERLAALAAARSAEPAPPPVESVAASAVDHRQPLGPQDDTTVLAIART